MTDFEKIKNAFIKGGLNRAIEIQDFETAKFIYLNRSGDDVFETCFEFDGNGNLIEIN